MFSEYASRFLNASNFQGRPDQQREPSRQGRGFGPTDSRYGSALRRPGNPYQSFTSNASILPFRARWSPAAPVPLFQSAYEEPRDADQEEHEREVSDYLALQRSRAQLGGDSGLTDSSEGDGRGSPRGGGYGHRRRRNGAYDVEGIESSWNGEDNQDPTQRANRHHGVPDDQLVDVGLESVRALPTDSNTNGVGDEEEQDLDEGEEPPPPFQHFLSPRTPPPEGSNVFVSSGESVSEHRATGRPPESAPQTALKDLTYTAINPFKHDGFWASLYLICLASIFASFILVLLHTTAPSRSQPLGDTVYTALHSSFYLLAVDTVVAVFLALLWLSLLRFHVRVLVYSMVFAVPIVSLTFSLYPFTSSFRGPWQGQSTQDQAMRWLSFFPALFATLWTVVMWRNRHALDKAVKILEFSCRIIAAQYALVLLGLATLAAIVAWTWIWVSMFTRVFLAGHLMPKRGAMFFIIDTGTWWLGVFFVLVYLWTLGIINGVQRVTTAATVSQWYFYRQSEPSPTSEQVVRAAFHHATTTSFGSICLSSMLAVLARIPLLIFPRRVTAWGALFTYSLVPSSITMMMDPLTLTYASIHSKPLGTAARSISQMTILRDTPRTATGGPSRYALRNGRQSESPLLSYNVAKILLYASRAIMAIALGFGAWVSTARMTTVAKGFKGSLYAYVVGLIAGSIGWAVLGAMEGIIASTVDAAVVCFASESQNGGVSGYCLEAQELFGDSPA